MGGEGEGDDPNQSEKCSNGDVKKAGGSTAQSSNGSPVLAQPERKQQERRKKAAMFLSRLKKGSEDEATQPVYG